jgi:aminoglycoside phosphotransferase
MIPTSVLTPTGSSVDLAVACATWPALAVGLAPAQMAQQFMPVLRYHYPDLLLVEVQDLAILQYRPERCVIRYQLALHEDVGNRFTELTLIGKFSQTDEGQQVYEAMSTLWANEFHPRTLDHIAVPAPLAYLPALKLLLQEEVPGRQLNDLIKAQPRPDYARLIARVLRKLHHADLRPGPVYDMQTHLARCYPSHQALAQACPELRKAIAAIVGSTAQLDQQIPASQYTPIHGDFHMKQIHVDADRCWLLDFDALSWGDPAADLGNVILTLQHKADRLPNVPELITALLDEYFVTMDRQIAGRIHLYEAVNGLRRACKQLRLQPPGWRAAAGQMIATAVAALDHPYA